MASAEEGVPPKAASELSTMKLRQLILYAAEVGVSEAELDAAEDQADHKSAVIELIISKTSVADEQSKLIALLRAELSAMKLTGLVLRAQRAGVSEGELEAAEDADDFKAAVTELIIVKEVSDAQDAEGADPTEVLRAELSAMMLTQLFIRAAAAGATEGEIEAAEDADDFKSAITELIIAKEVTLREAQDAEGADPNGLMRAELSAMKLTQLFIRAAAAGATKAELEAAEDTDDFKSAIIELLVASDETWADNLISNSLPSTSFDKAAIINKLRTGSKTDRQHACQQIEQAVARKDVEVLRACVAPLLEVLSMDASEVQATEFLHVGVLLGKVVAVDVFALAPECFADDRWWRPCESKSNALGVALAKPISELNETDARTLSCLFSWQSVMGTEGVNAIWHQDHSFTDRDMASFEFHTFVEGWMGVVPTSRTSCPDDYSARNMKFSTLIMDLLRGSKVSDEYERAGMWFSLLLCNFGMHDVGKHQIDGGLHALAMAELKTAPTINWVSSSKDPAGLFGAVWSATQQASLPSPHLSDTESTNLLYTSGLLQAAMSEVKAAEVLGDNDDLQCFSVYFAVVCVLLNLDSSVPEAQQLVREGAGSLRWVMELEKSVNCVESWACTSRGLVPMICASFFGRDESGGPFNFSDEEMDAVLAFAVDSLRGNLINVYPIQPMWTSVPCLACSVSDTNKDKMLRNTAWIEHLVDGLMLDPSHPRNQDDQPTGPNDPITAGRVQREYAEALAQFAVYEPGQAAMLKIPVVVQSLKQLVTQALTDEAKMLAEEALAALGIEKTTKVERVESHGTKPHLMMSYNWAHQQVIMRVVAWLQKHGYLVWVDTEQMKGDTVDSMAMAVEGAELMLIGVSRKYKESSNCRMEAQYGMQKRKPFVPLMMEDGYEADGWLGLLLGTTLWHAMYGTTLSSDDAFDSRMSNLAREIGDRGRADATAPTSALHKELLDSKVSALRKRAVAAGISEEELERADDADDLKTALIDLILAAGDPAGETSSDALRTELQALKLGSLRKRAVVEGVDATDLEEADDADDIKSAVIELIVAMKQ